MNRPVCVLGMHRSGTSCLAGLLEETGLYLGSVSQWNTHNTKGNREHPTIVELNDSVLASNGSSWDKPNVCERWDQQQQANRDLLISAFSAESKQWGFKDPRSLFTLNFWQEALEPRFIGTFRHPAKVAASLLHRNRFPPSQSFQLWELYNQRLLTLHAQHSFPLINFDAPKTEYLSAIQRKAANIVNTAHLVGDFFEPSLRNQSEVKVSEREVPHSSLELYNQLVHLYAS